MCQAFEGEQQYMLGRDESIRRMGREAYLAGSARDTNPMSNHSNPYYSDKRQWFIGWDEAALAAKGE